MREKINCKGCGQEIEVNNNRGNKSKWRQCSCGAQFRPYRRRGKIRRIGWRLPNNPNKKKQ